jgi:HEAT repeat protein
MKAPAPQRTILSEDLELRKQIAADAQTGATAASPGVRLFQFFLVPLLIVGVCVLLYAFLAYVVANPRTPQDWLQDIKEGGPNTRNHATLKLAESIRRMETPDLSLTPEIMALFREVRPDDPERGQKINMRAYLAACLGSLRDPRACELLVEAARSDPRVDTRAACIDALGAIKEPWTLAELVKLLDDGEGAIRKYAAFNAGAVAEKAEGEPRAAAAAALRAKLADPQPDVGWNAAFALAYFLGDRSGTDTLKKMLDRKYLGEVIRNDPQALELGGRAVGIACQAAAKLKDESFLPALRKLTDDRTEPDPNVRFLAHKAIREIERK